MMAVTSLIGIISVRSETTCNFSSKKCSLSSHPSSISSPLCSPLQCKPPNEQLTHPSTDGFSARFPASRCWLEWIVCSRSFIPSQLLTSWLHMLLTRLWTVSWTLFLENTMQKLDLQRLKRTIFVEVRCNGRRRQLMCYSCVSGDVLRQYISNVFHASWSDGDAVIPDMFPSMYSCSNRMPWVLVWGYSWSLQHDIYSPFLLILHFP